MIAALTYDELKTLSPCSDSMKRVVKLMGGEKKWNGNKIDAAQARKLGCTFDDIVWAASAVARNDKNIERKLRLWMADCAARVLHIYERNNTSDAPRNAIVAARQFARGEIGKEELAAASASVWTAASASVWTVASASVWTVASASARASAWASVWASSRDAVWASSRNAASAAARAFASAAVWASSRNAASAAEEAWQFDRLVLWLSENEPADYPLPERITS